MNLYILGFCTAEESPKYVLAHEKEFSKEEFDKMAMEATLKAIKEDEANGEQVSWFMNVCTRMVNTMMIEHGFSIAQTKAEFRPFGWASMFKAGDWVENRGDDLSRLTKFLNEHGYTDDIKYRETQDDENNRT